MRRSIESSRFPFTPGLSLVMALLCLTSSACYRYASIERRSVPALQARIDRSDRENLFVTTSDGQEQTVSRAEVVNISHPGKIRLTTGILIASAGVAMVLYGLLHQPCSGRPPGDACEQSWDDLGAIADGVAFLTGGGVLAISGGLSYYNSVTVAEPAAPMQGTQAMRHPLPRLTCSFCSH